MITYSALLEIGINMLVRFVPATIIADDQMISLWYIEYIE